ncbi:ABC transporter ATP-binding protein [Propylenella binzhouense]|uniref:ABC transporter ATP-binding protein n=1 Tax=Propylenella binzhouense TaxID=2555902 RepID=A0A964T2K7_9HYPH|nr:ABC transporter ATP-binding protein [Propylenella binzhouense]MYZ46437.1 ABC transporter ATP-binding protein [Propylenella binzhouense]
MTRPILNLVDVTRDYGNATVIGPVSFSAEQGEFISLLGPSGCGKSTLLRCIAGFEPVNGGRIELNGKDVSREAPHRRRVGLVFQSFALFPHLTVARNVAFGLRLRRTGKEETARRVGETLELVGLSHLADRYPAQLSGGQQQRVAIARALVLRPEIMLLDEPLSSLDAKLRLHMRRELRAMQQDLNMTFVHVTHDQDEALAMSDKIVVLSEGRIEQMGSPREIYDRPDTRFIADFIGSSNLLEISEIEPAGDGMWSVRLNEDQRIVIAADADPRQSGRHWLSIRPESLSIGGEDTVSGSCLTGTAIGHSYGGDRTEIFVRLDGAQSDAPPIVAHADRSFDGRVALTITGPGATFVRA